MKKNLLSLGACLALDVTSGLAAAWTGTMMIDADVMAEAMRESALSFIGPQTHDAALAADGAWASS